MFFVFSYLGCGFECHLEPESWWQVRLVFVRPLQLRAARPATALYASNNGLDGILNANFRPPLEFAQHGLESPSAFTGARHTLPGKFGFLRVLIFGQLSIETTAIPLRRQLKSKLQFLYLHIRMR
jgi:hypothetical protein